MHPPAAVRLAYKRRMNPVDNQSHTLVLGLHPRTFHVLQDTTQHQQFLHVDRDNRLGRAYTRNRIFFTRPAGSVVSQVRIDLDICGAKGCDELNGGIRLQTEMTSVCSMRYLCTQMQRRLSGCTVHANDATATSHVRVVYT